MSEFHIRWLIRRDMPEVLDIERNMFEFVWSEDDFIRCLRQRNCIGMCADLDDKLVGYMIYELHKRRLHLLNLAVHPDYTRQKIGTKMIEKLQNKLNSGKRERIMLELREKNLVGQLFFKSLGFLATGVLKDFYNDTTEDAYRMEYRLMPTLKTNEFSPINRVSNLLQSE